MGLVESLVCQESRAAAQYDALYLEKRTALVRCTRPMLEPTAIQSGCAGWADSAMHCQVRREALREVRLGGGRCEAGAGEGVRGTRCCSRRSPPAA